MMKHMNVNIVGRLNMSKEATFYKLKYSTLPTPEQIEELKSTEFGSFVLFDLASAVLSESVNAEKKALLKRLEKDPFSEMIEFFKDLSESQREDIVDLKKSTLNEFIKLMIIADEMKNG
jgi:hypothetical protein